MLESKQLCRMQDSTRSTTHWGCKASYRPSGKLRPKPNAPSRDNNMMQPTPRACEPSISTLQPTFIRLHAMSVQLRISDRRPSVKGNSRSILHSSEVPLSPTVLGPICEALESDGRPCKDTHATTAGDPWCSKHHREWTDLNAKWSKTHKEAEKQTVNDSEEAKQKVLKLRHSVNLRRQIRDRFYPRGGDIQDYIKWFAKLETDVRQLADSILSRTHSNVEIDVH
jgi:hypothetical protein